MLASSNMEYVLNPRGLVRVAALGMLAIGFALTSGVTSAQEPNSKLYIPPSAPNQTVADGTKVVTTTAPAFNVVLQGEIFRAHLPFQIVSDPAQADYLVEWAAIPEEGRSGYHFQFGGGVSSKALYTVSVSLLNKDKQMVWAGSADKKNLRDCAMEITRQLKAQLKSETKHKKS